MINAGVPLQNIGLLPTVGTCIIKQQMRDEAGIDHLLRSEHQVETLTTGHYSKTLCRRDSISPGKDMV